MKLTIASDTLRQIVAHLESSLPVEGCGLLAAFEEGDSERRAVCFYPGRNIDCSLTRFTMDPLEVFSALREIEAKGWMLGAIVHSHPRTPPTPSPTDLREAYYPHAWSLIVSFAQVPPEVRVWSLRTGEGGIEPMEVVLHTAPS